MAEYACYICLIFLLRLNVIGTLLVLTAPGGVRTGYTYTKKKNNKQNKNVLHIYNFHSQEHRRRAGEGRGRTFFLLFFVSS